jgi:hypothetical protein
MRDIDRALLLGYPEEKRYKLYERKGQCLVAMMARVGSGETKLRLAAKAHVAFKTASRLLEDNKSKEKVTGFRAKLDDAMKKLQWVKENNCDEGTTRPSPSMSDISNVLRPNSHYPAMTHGIEVVYEEGKGRHVRASEDIPAGTTLLVEEPVMSALDPSRRGTNCLHCFRIVLANVPCVWCADVNFCSVACRDIALKTYHGFECALAPVINQSGLGPTALMALRAVTRFGRRKVIGSFGEWKQTRWWGITESSEEAAKSESDDFLHSRGNDSDQEGKKTEKKKKEKLEREEERSGGRGEEEKQRRKPTIYGGGTHYGVSAVGEGKTYKSLDFENALHHFAPTPTAAMQEASWSPPGKNNKKEHLKHATLTRAFVAAFLTKCLKNLCEDFFDDDHDSSEKNEITVASVIAHFLAVLPSNCHDIGSLEKCDRKSTAARGSEMLSLGSGMYNTLSLFNHSCVPCFVRANVGNVVVCVTVRNVAKGEEITENYGLYHTKDERARRKSVLLENYGFECRCRACKEDWPLKGNLKKSKSGREKKADLVIELLISDRWTEAKIAMENCESLLLKDRTPPSREDVAVQTALWEYLWEKIGNKRVKIM